MNHCSDLIASINFSIAMPVRGNTDFSFGVEYQFGKQTQVSATTQSGLISREVQSLKSLRRAALPSHWRKSVDISAGIIKLNAP